MVVLEDDLKGQTRVMVGVFSSAADHSLELKVRDLKLEIEVNRGGLPTGAHIPSSEFVSIVVRARNVPVTREGWSGLLNGRTNLDSRGQAILRHDLGEGKRGAIDLAVQLDGVDSLHSQIFCRLDITFVIVNVCHSDATAPDVTVVLD